MYKTYLNWSTRNPWKVLIVWAVIFLIALPFALTLSHRFRTNGLGVPGSPSAVVSHIMARDFGHYADPTATVVFSSHRSLDTTIARRFIRHDLRNIGKISGVVHIPTLDRFNSSPHHHVLWAPVYLHAESAGALTDSSIIPKIRQNLRSSPQIRAGITGLVPLERSLTNSVNRDLKTAEIWTLPLTLIALIWIFRSFIAPIGPMAIGFGGITVGLALTSAIAGVMRLAPEVEDAAAMIGLGVGIDYALLMVQRYRIARAAMHSPPEAAVISATTAGRSVLFSGTIVATAFCLVLLINQPLLRSMAIGSVAAVTSTVIAALTLLPALLVVLDRVLDWPFTPRSSQASPWWRKRAKLVMKHPWFFLSVTTAILLGIAFPVHGIRFWNPGVNTLPVQSPTRTTYQVLLRHTYPGVQGPVSVLVSSRHSLWSASAWHKVRALEVQLAHVQDVHTISPSLPHLPSWVFKHAPASPLGKILGENNHRLILTVFPNTRPESQATQKMVTNLRNISEPGLRVLVGSGAAYTVDVIHLIFHWLPELALLVSFTTFILLWRLFRTITLPIKAILLNFLSVSAASGLLVLVFQRGITAPITGIHATGAIDWTTPIILFTVLFGLSTDYEVFLLTRIQDHHNAGADDPVAIEEGMAETGRIITGAALIMVTVFLAFGSIGLEFMQELGFGLGFAILIDATLVRLFLVPSIMRLLGRYNWWQPSFKPTKSPS